MLLETPYGVQLCYEGLWAPHPRILVPTVSGEDYFLGLFPRAIPRRMRLPQKTDTTRDRNRRSEPPKFSRHAAEACPQKSPARDTRWLADHGLLRDQKLHQE